jgi:ribosomal protein S27E
MSEFITLSCPSCGARLQVTQDLERFACSNCGNEHIVKRTGGTVSLAPVVAQLSRVQAGVDKTAAELAIARLQGEIHALEARDSSEEARTNGIAAGSTLSY